MIAARNRWCLAFDNLSHISNSLSDALCRLATGGGLSTRELYSSDEEVLFEALRPVIINGIEDLATRGDLLSRAVVLYLPPLNPVARRREADLWREFEQARPSICGALYDAVSVALRRVESVQLDSLPRMADFAAWAVAAEPAFSIPQRTFIEAYSVNRATANTTALEDSPLSEAVMKLLAAQPKATVDGRSRRLPATYFLMSRAGLEPATHWLKERCGSVQLRLLRSIKLTTAHLFELFTQPSLTELSMMKNLE
ncbi:MAG TPA: hypothetical protein VF544_04845 [Pyrinomonadaceae bacterium]|jgi:hypothetical protein